MPLLTKMLLAGAEGFELHDVRCECGKSRWSPPEPIVDWAIVFVRRGCFLRRAAGREDLLDPAVVYFERPGDEQQVAHPLHGGDACTSLSLTPAFLAEVAGQTRLPAEPVLTSPATDLRHRLLLAECGRLDAFELTERVVLLVASVLEHARELRDGPSRATTAAARRRLVDGVRERLAADPRVGLVELSRSLAVSPHHLSRIFRAQTGETLSCYRNRLRVRLALEQLADPSIRIARLAAELGFADQAHMTRVMRRETGMPPAAVRRLFVI